MGGTTAFAVRGLLTEISGLHAPPLTLYMYDRMSRPPIASAALVAVVWDAGSPEMVGPGGISAPMSAPLAPVATAGPGPGRRANQSRNVLSASDSVICEKPGSPLVWS